MFGFKDTLATILIKTSHFHCHWRFAKNIWLIRDFCDASHFSGNALIFSCINKSIDYGQIMDQQDFLVLFYKMQIRLFFIPD